MLSSLNEDCLRLICNALDVKSHVSLAFTSSHLRNIVSEAYKTVKTVRITPKMWPYFYEHEEHFETFLQSVGEHITELALDGIDGRKLYLLQSIHLPKLTTFSLKLTQVYDPVEDFKVKDHFHALLKSMCSNLEGLKLRGISHEMLFALRGLKFPQLTTCGVLLRRVAAEPGDLHEADVFVEIFPKLSKLLLLTDTYGSNLWLLENLTELDLINCYNFESGFMRFIFKELKLKKLSVRPFDAIGCYENEDYFTSVATCQTLEELHVEYHHLELLTNEMPRLKNLRKLTFTPKESCFCHHKPESFLIKFAHHFGEAIHTLMFRTVPFDMTHEDYLPFFEKMKNLRRLIIVQSLPKNELLSVVAQAAAANLQEFRYLRSVDNEDVNEGLKDILKHCRNLKTFDVSFGNADLDFLKDALGVLTLFGVERIEPLTIRCHNTQISQDDLKHLILPQNVSVTLQQERVDYGIIETIYCEWEPNMVKREMFSSIGIW